MKKRVCVVGGGSWGKNHIKTLNSMGVLGGIVEISKDVLNELLIKYPKTKTYSKLEDALDDNFDGFTIASPAETHFSIAKKIINSGKHLLIEKPMVLKVNEAEELVLLAKQKKVNLMVGHVLLFHPAIQKIKQIINDGVIGELQYIYSNRLNLGKVRSEENVFWSFAPHDIAIFQYLTESFPENIYAHGSVLLQRGIYDSTMTHFEYKSGVSAHIFVSWMHPFKEHRLVVIGKKAMISFEDSKEGKPLKLYSKTFDLSKGIPEKIDGPVRLIPYDKKLPLTSELEYFVEHCSNKKISFSDGKHGLEVVKILVKASNNLLQK